MQKNISAIACKIERGDLIMTESEKLTAAVVNKIKSDYKDDVALLIAVEGHQTNGDMHGECFDYFVPRTERGYQLSQALIVNGVGHDLYPRSWERTEKTANLEDMTICLANAKILYTRSKEESEQFLRLQKQLYENLKNPQFAYQKALIRIDGAMDVYRAMAFEEKVYRVKAAARFVNSYVTSAVAFLNGTFSDSSIFTPAQAYNEDRKSRIYHCPGLKMLPEDFFKISEVLLESMNPDELIKVSRRLILTTRKFLKEHNPKIEEEHNLNNEGFLDWYNELSLSFRRIRYFADCGMAEEALTDGANVQSEISVVSKEFNFPEIDVLSAFDRNNLNLFAERANEAERTIRKILTERGMKLIDYKSADEYAAAL